MGKIAEWFNKQKEAKKDETDWKDKIRAEAKIEARKDAELELKNKYKEEEKNRLVSGKSKLAEAFTKEFTNIGDKFGKNIGENVGGNTETKSEGFSFGKVLENEFGTKKADPFKKSGDMHEMIGIKKSEDVINKKKIDNMLGKGIDTSDPQDKIGVTDFESGLNRALGKDKKKKE